MKDDLVTPGKNALKVVLVVRGGRRGGAAFATASWPTGSPSGPRSRHKLPAGESMDREEEVEEEEELKEENRYI